MAGRIHWQAFEDHVGIGTKPLLPVGTPGFYLTGLFFT